MSTLSPIVSRNESPAGWSSLSALDHHIAGRTLVTLTTAPEAVQATTAIFDGEVLAVREVGRVPADTASFVDYALVNFPEYRATVTRLMGDLAYLQKHIHKAQSELRGFIMARAEPLIDEAPELVAPLCEECARLLGDAYQIKLAKEMASTARQLERAHGLPIDPHRHRQAMSDLIKRGLVAVRELKAEMEQASFDTAVALAEEWLGAGHSAHSTFLSDMRKAAAREGRNKAETDRLIGDLVLTSPGLAGTSHVVALKFAPLWKKSQFRDTLLSTRFVHSRNDYYLALLERAGVLAELRRNPEQHAAWIAQLIPLLVTSVSSAAVRDEIARADFSTVSEPIVLNNAPIGVVNALLLAGAPVVFPEGARIHYIPWSNDNEPDWGVTGIVDHDQALDIVLSAFRSLHADTWFSELFPRLGGPALLTALCDRIGKHLRDSTIDEARAIVSHLLKVDWATVADEIPGAVATALNPGWSEVLASGLRHGVLNELDWSTFVRTYRDLASHGTVDVSESSPGAVLISGNRVAYVEGNTVSMFDIEPPDFISSATRYGWESQGDILALWPVAVPGSYQVGWQGMWVAEGTMFELRTLDGYEEPLPVSSRNDEGYRILSSGALIPGDTPDRISLKAIQDIPNSEKPSRLWAGVTESRLIVDRPGGGQWRVTHDAQSRYISAPSIWVEDASSPVRDIEHWRTRQVDSDPMRWIPAVLLQQLPACDEAASRLLRNVTADQAQLLLDEIMPVAELLDTEHPELIAAIEKQVAHVQKMRKECGAVLATQQAKRADPLHVSDAVASLFHFTRYEYIRAKTIDARYALMLAGLEQDYDATTSTGTPIPVFNITGRERFLMGRWASPTARAHTDHTVEHWQQWTTILRILVQRGLLCSAWHRAETTQLIPRDLVVSDAIVHSRFGHRQLGDYVYLQDDRKTIGGQTLTHHNEPANRLRKHEMMSLLDAVDQAVEKEKNNQPAGPHPSDVAAITAGCGLLPETIEYLLAGAPETKKVDDLVDLFGWSTAARKNMSKQFKLVRERVSWGWPDYTLEFYAAAIPQDDPASFAYGRLNVERIIEWWKQVQWRAQNA
ncbi:hypothetical protein [Corynebacterium cystitidis]|uniref:Uncharacterized protein n=1 Tax=Corynebacterium cystitidis DSM 20524 TaxID=1121357 RepID=A0A1H9PU57_9CORY|nr:hypothetical protein [Corynebacterium cystitidis]WJY82393.1 hypothetical protein CCYS_07345 [Corynebacterium cystitidis DSM 20524]SER51319.1 hypothetical protein SAMN05661109_00449 [Corynebacterium cystitidis DSM 20524]SNV76004.1 Uncharacterised protein [Corynebacterium cystitidis]